MANLNVWLQICGSKKLIYIKTTSISHLSRSFVNVSYMLYIYTICTWLKGSELVKIKVSAVAVFKRIC